MIGPCIVVQVVVDEKLAENSERLGAILRADLAELQNQTDRVLLVRGKGLFNAVVLKDKGGITAWDVCLRLKENGLLVGTCTDCTLEI